MTSSTTPRTLIKGLLLAIGALILPLYAIEAYLLLQQPDKRAEVTSRRADDAQTYPAIFPGGFVDRHAATGEGSPVSIDGEEVLPLAGVPDAATVYCYDAKGEIFDYQSDDHGFRNPADINGEPTMAMMGGAFAQGHCVAEEETLRAKLAPLGAVASFGMDGSGPLAQLAIFREYVEPLALDRVIWMFFEGEDVGRLADEGDWPLLAAYLEPGHSQQLVARKDALSESLRSLLDERFDEGMIDHLMRTAAPKPSLVAELKNSLTLKRLRALLPGAKALPGLPSPDQLPTFEGETAERLTAIWQEVVEAEKASGGEVTFVYVPAAARFMMSDATPYETLEQQVSAAWTELGADHVLLAPVIGSAEDPLALYSWQHFNTEGYRLAAEALHGHLERKVAASN